MEVGASVAKAIEDWSSGHADAAMLHACNAVDGTARKRYPRLGSNARFTRLLRDSYSVLGPMGLPGIDIVHSRFPVNVDKPKAPGGGVDVADIIYGIHRCYHGHGEALPQGFELLPDASGPAGESRLQIDVANGRVRLSDRIIFGMLAVAVASPENAEQTAPERFYLTFTNVLWLHQWWGRYEAMESLLHQVPLPSVRFAFDGSTSSGSDTEIG